MMVRRVFNKIIDNGKECKVHIFLNKWVYYYYYYTIYIQCECMQIQASMTCGSYRGPVGLYTGPMGV